MRFRLIISGIAALVVVYVVFWFVLAHMVRVKIADWVDEQRAAGTEITYSALDVGGFPYRIAIKVRDLNVKGAEDGLTWTMSSPAAVAVAMPWNRRHAIVQAESGILTITPADETPQSLTVTGGRASIILDRRQAPSRISATAASLSAAGSAIGEQGFHLKDGELHWRAADQVALEAALPEGEEDPREPLAWQLAVKADQITHSVLEISPYGGVIQEMSMVLEVRGSGIDAQATLETIIAWRDHGGTVEVTSFGLIWGELDVILRGSLTLDQQFRPLGAFTADVKGYERVIEYLHKAGHIDEAEAETAQLTLEAIVDADTDNDGRLSVPITLQAGRLFIGPLPVANLPPVLPVAEPEPVPTPDVRQRPLPPAPAPYEAQEKPAPRQPAPELPEPDDEVGTPRSEPHAPEAEPDAPEAEPSVPEAEGGPQEEIDEFHLESFPDETSYPET